MITKEVKLIAGVIIIAMLTGLYFYIDNSAYKRGYQAAENKYIKKDNKAAKKTIATVAATTLANSEVSGKTADNKNKADNIKYVYITKRVPVNTQGGDSCNTYNLNSLYNTYAGEQNALPN